ncbi:MULTISPECIES: DUF5996 family protein [unclassified Frankia]
MVEMLAPFPLSCWAETRQTVHRYLQVVGKIRLAASPRRNHWWNVPFQLTGRGLTTRPMGQLDGNPIFTIDFDFVGHELVVQRLDGETISFPLVAQSVASFYRRTFDALAALGIKIRLDHPHPFDLLDAARPFNEDTEHAAYDPAAVARYWQTLSQVNLLLEEFAAGFSGKVSPVHHFWHTFDIAHTRFADRPVDQSAETDPVTREAYSREVVSFGVLPLAALERSPDRRAGVLGFYDSAYRAGAGRAGWDIERFACPHGVTDPVLAPGH